MKQSSAEAGKSVRPSYPIAEYDQFRESIYRQIRAEAFGEDIGQFSWITADEFRKFIAQLGLGSQGVLLDVACGSGGLSQYAAQLTGCKVIGIDLSEEGINTAKTTAEERNLADRTEYVNADASGSLPLEDGSADAVLCIDAINHFADKGAVLAEWKRILRPGGHFLFTDAAIVGGPSIRDELLTRSQGMGPFIFTPAGFYERVIEEAGFVNQATEDVTETIASTAQRWHNARVSHREDLMKLENEEQYEQMQKTLSMAALLAREKRLCRIAFRATKP